MKKIHAASILSLPNGTVLEYRCKLYWLSNGLEGRIVTGQDGTWQFVLALRWKTCKIIFRPDESQ